MRSYLAPSAPPGSLKTWRCKQAPRKLVEIDPASVSDGAAAAIAQGRGSVPVRQNSVRLSRVSPEHGHRLDESCTVEKEPMPPLRVSFEENHPWSVASASEWPRAVPLAPRSRDLDFSCFSSHRDRALGVSSGRHERSMEVVELRRRWQAANGAITNRLESRNCHAILLAWQHCVIKRRVNSYEDMIQALEIRHEALVVELEELNRASVEAEGRQAALAEAAEERHAVALATAHACAERSVAEAQRAMARHSRKLALGHGNQLARQRDRMSQLTIFSAWQRLSLAARLESEWQNRLQERCLKTTTSSSDGCGALEAGRHAHRSRLKAWMSAMDGMLTKAVVASWRTAIQHKRAVGTVQAKLFAEEAQRTALLVAQRTENDAKLLEAETRHRAAVQCVRAELAEVEAKHSESLSQQESQMATRLAASEADFSQALNAAVQAHDRQATQVTQTAEESQISQDPRITEALRVLRQRAEHRVSEVESRHAEILRSREEEARQQVLEAENRAMEEVEEREAQARREMERRLRDLQEQLGAALEAQHTEADIRLIEAETRYQERLHLQQDAFNERYAELARRYDEVLQVLKDTTRLSLHQGGESWHE